MLNTIITNTTKLGTKMKITIKQLQGSECSLEVDPTTSILEIKQQIKRELNIAIASMRLLHLGRTLADEQLINSYPAIKEGTKLNLSVKKPDDFYDIFVKEYKKMGLTDAEAAKTANRLLTVIKEKLDRLSWDDLNRLSRDFLQVKDGKRPLRNKPNSTRKSNGA